MVQTMPTRGRTLPVRVAVDDGAGGVRTVRIRGDLCYSAVEELPPAVELLAVRPGRVVADLRGVAFVDLAGWRWLAAVRPAVDTLPVDLEVRPGPALHRMAAFVRRAVLPADGDDTAWLAELVSARPPRS